LRADAAANLVVVIDIEAMPVAVSPPSMDASSIVGRWAAFMQQLAPVGNKAESGPMQEMIISSSNGEMLINRLGDHHWILLTLEQSALLGQARHALSEHIGLLERRLH
jgi:predicted regulator of Ras-like GTPase activity (Roadblock/LC7/MglB family)